MQPAPFTLLDETRATSVVATIRDGRVWLPPADVHSALGWNLKPQGLCKADRCIPLGTLGTAVAPEGIDLAALAAVLSRPLALDADERAACLGAAGTVHRLSDYRGKKVFLVAYASW